MIHTLRTFLSLIPPAAAAVACTSKAAAQTGKTLEDLHAAFNGESNARARYLAFASKADQEGYAQAASLFRAVARAEQIHAANHAAVINRMGGTAQAKIETPVAKSTRENLQAAIAGECYERDVMYPQFIADAHKDKNSAAARTFDYALKAEAEHAKLFTEALETLVAMTTKSYYFVCPVCGFTAKQLNFLQCFVCSLAKEKFEAVN